jgi:hypothetical protein
LVTVTSTVTAPSVLQHYIIPIEALSRSPAPQKKRRWSAFRRVLIA